MSIKPEYSQKIFSGQKKYEFRRRRPKLTVEAVIVYESSPIRNIVGGFSVRRIHSGSPEAIWERCKESSGIDKKNYMNYCQGRPVVYAFEIKETFKFEKPMNPFKMMLDFKPPQNFHYIDDSVFSEFVENRGDAKLARHLFGNNVADECDKPLSFIP